MVSLSCKDKEKVIQIENRTVVQQNGKVLLLNNLLSNM